MRFFQLLFLTNSFLISINIHAQEKKPIEFLEYEVEWIQEPWVDTLSVYDQDYTLVRNPIFKDNYMIAVYTQFQYAPFGFFIHRINLSNGNVDWSYNEFSGDQYTRRMVQDFKLVGDTLELYLLEESETIYNFVYPTWDSCHVALLKLDINNGEVIESKRTDHNDPLNLVLGKSWFIGSIQVITGINGGYRVLRTEKKETIDTIRVENFISTDLDYNGHILRSDTVTFEFPRFNAIISQNLPFNSNSFLSHVESTSTAANDPKYYSSLFIMDDRLQSYDSIQLHNYYNVDSLVSIVLLLYNDDKFLIETIKNYSFEFPFEQYYFMFNYQGDILYKFENTIDKQARGEVMVPIAFNDEDRLTGIGEYQDWVKDSLTHLYYWKSNSLGGIDTLLDIKIKDKDIEAYPLKGYITEDNDLIAYYNYRQPSYPSELGPGHFSPNWYFWIKIRGEDLGLKTSNTEQLNVESTIKLYPNPVADKLQIQFDSEVAGKIQLINVEGKFIYEVEKEIIEENIEIDMRKYESGIYFLKFISNKGELIESRKIIKH